MVLSSDVPLAAFTLPPLVLVLHAASAAPPMASAAPPSSERRLTDEPSRLASLSGLSGFSASTDIVVTSPSECRRLRGGPEDARAPEDT
jgi:hypothetical protein